jgi:hypothetical protein
VAGKLRWQVAVIRSHATTLSEVQPGWRALTGHLGEQPSHERSVAVALHIPSDLSVGALLTDLQNHIHRRCDLAYVNSLYTVAAELLRGTPSGAVWRGRNTTATLTALPGDSHLYRIFNSS